MNDIVTKSELTAVRFLMAANEIPMSTEPLNYHKEADKIIMLAESIKVERQTASMLSNK